jgi:hypothetical protein
MSVGARCSGEDREMETTRVCDYSTGKTLAGVASDELAYESAKAGSTGAVGAYLDEAGIWQWVDESDSRRTHTVYVEV